MTTASSSVSAVQRDSDFAAELLLNRVMNGQLETSSGKSINAATRSMAIRHDSTAFEHGVVAENIAFGKTITLGTENALTELIDQVKKIRDISGSDGDIFRSQEITSELKNNLDKILNTEVQGVAVLKNANDAPNGGGLVLDIGVGIPEKLKIGDADVLGGTAFSTLYNNLSNLTTTSADTVRQYCNDAIGELMGKIANQGVQSNILNNRYTLLNELAASYHDFSDDQAVNMGGSMQVLNAFS